MSPDLVQLSVIEEAAARIGHVVRVTPLLPAMLPGERAWFLKCESLQLGGAFKIRGAYNMMAQLPADARRRGVITYSSGNHGQAVALAGRLLGAPAVIVMPTTAPGVKVEGARAFGAEVLFEGTTSLDRKRRAEAEASARHLTIIPPFDHAAIIAGQGTVGLEIVRQCPDVARVYVPIGGGGLISGVAAAVKALKPGVRVIGVEPAGAPRMAASRAAGGPVTLPGAASVADGLLPLRPGDLTFAHAAAFVDELMAVADAAILDAVRWLSDRARLVVEPSGAASVAALQAREGDRTEHDGSGPAVAVLSGGNIAREALARL